MIKSDQRWIQHNFHTAVHHHLDRWFVSRNGHFTFHSWSASAVYIGMCDTAEIRLLRWQVRLLFWWFLYFFVCDLYWLNSYFPLLYLSLWLFHSCSCLASNFLFPLSYIISLSFFRSLFCTASLTLAATKCVVRLSIAVHWWRENDKNISIWEAEYARLTLHHMKFKGLQRILTALDIFKSLRKSHNGNSISMYPHANTCVWHTPQRGRGTWRSKQKERAEKSNTIELMLKRQTKNNKTALHSENDFQAYTALHSSGRKIGEANTDVTTQPKSDFAHRHRFFSAPLMLFRKWHQNRQIRYLYTARANYLNGQFRHVDEEH